MFIERLPKNVQNNLALLGKSPIKDIFYLAGGTACALWLGHRISVDLDFFTQKRFDIRKIVEELRKLGDVGVEQESKNTFNGKLNEIRISFFFYPYPLMDAYSELSGVKIAGIFDIACMKLDAVSSRGTKRDFVDLYFLIQEVGNFERILSFYTQKYGKLGGKKIHILKSLTYFVDAEEEEMPRMLTPVDWKDVKIFFEKEVAKIGQKITS